MGIKLKLNRGYEGVKKEKDRQEKEKEQRGSRLFRFFLREDGDEADIRFLTEEPVNFYEHSIKNSDGTYTNATCSGDENCPHCASGNRPQFKSAYLIIDRREVEIKRDGKKTKLKDQVRLFVYGTKVVSQLDRLSNRGGISNREMVIIRIGKGTSTTYTFEKGDELKISSKQIEALLPESLKGAYDGTTDSLYDIIEEQIILGLPSDAKPTRPVDEEEEEEETTTVFLEDDEEEETVPSRKIKPKTSGNSVKAKLKLKK